MAYKDNPVKKAGKAKTSFVLLDESRIAAMGNHSEISEHSPLYRSLVDASGTSIPDIEGRGCDE